jgi:hypothetical protein
MEGEIGQSETEGSVLSMKLGNAPGESDHRELIGNQN